MMSSNMTELYGLENAIENLSFPDNPNISNDNNLYYDQPDYQYGTLNDSAASQSSYEWKKNKNDSFTVVQLQQKICNALFSGQNVYKWKNTNSLNDWYYFQEAVKKHKDFMLSHIQQLLKKDLNMMNIYDPQYVKGIIELL